MRVADADAGTRNGRGSTSVAGSVTGASAASLAAGSAAARAGSPFSTGAFRIGPFLTGPCSIGAGSASGAVATGKFNAGPDTLVAAEDLSAILDPGHDGMGWLAQRGYVPLGYKGDAAKTAATFPVIDGVRYSVPGDRARHLEDGSIELLGRDSVTINSGGEKVFVEEVETAIASHPAVADVVVSGRPSERWGQEVVAIVALAEGATAEAQELIDHAAGVIARYKLPKAVVFRPVIERSPAGKADYRWAREQALSEGA